LILADTNVVVRLFVDDDAAQFARARTLFDAGGVHVPLSVVLETEWVLRSRYRFRPRDVAAALDYLAGLPGVTIEHGDRLASAVAWSRSGIDLADALHLAAMEPGDVIATFDRDLVRQAQALGLDAREP
jgi:predicted nucleic-acid-binding protein